MASRSSGESPSRNDSTVTASALGLALAALSALGTAIAHAMVKAGRDKLAVQVWIRLGGLIFAPPFLATSPLPHRALLGWLVVAAAAHGVYQAVLAHSYHANDFAAAYPIARGTGLLLTAVGGLALLGDRVPVGQVAGIALVAAGILTIARFGRLHRAGLALALATGTMTAVYSIVDAHAMRIAPAIGTFLGWFFLLDSVCTPTLFALTRPRGERRAILLADRRTGFYAAIGALAAFVPALIAYRFAPAGVVNALRETSILIALAAGRLWLGERPGRWHWAAGFAIAAGAIVVVAAN